MSTLQLNFSVAALSDRGRKRSSNEDSSVAAPEHGVFLVCDGMGGAAAGEIASSMAVEETLRRLASPIRPCPQALREAVEAANLAIHTRASQNPHLHGMGTTLVGLVLDGPRAWVVNVGDSRCYRLRQGTLEQITLDHSLVEERVRQGQMSPAEAQSSPLRNIITRALGTQPTVECDLFELTPEPGDLYLLCTDGLTNELDNGSIACCLRASHSLDEACVRLVHDALQAGGHDNITCILLRADA